MTQEHTGTTICTHCRHFQQLEPDSPRVHCWYNHLCAASRFPVRISPYNGAETSYTFDMYGKPYDTEHPWQYCRDINDGHCPKYEEKT